MRRQDEVRQGHELGRDCVALHARDLAAARDGSQRRLVDQAAARGVDDQRLAFQQRELSGTKHVARAGIEWESEGYSAALW